MERHVWQDALDEITSFTKTPQDRSIYNQRKETIERSFAEAKVNQSLLRIFCKEGLSVIE